MSIKVLLADDHAVLRDGLRFLLEAAGDIEVTADADNGREAVELAKRLRPDVAVIDIEMPEMNGIEAARRIIAGGSSTRVIILSMHSSPVQVFEALKAGVSGYILKESAGKEVVKAIHAVHSGARYLGQRITDAVIDDYLTKRSPIYSLSARERQVMQSIVEGKTNSDTAQILGLSVKSVETYRSRLMRKLDVSDVPSLVKLAIKHGMTGV